MRILLVCGQYPPAMCGVGDYTVHLAAALAKLPHVQVGLLSMQAISPCPSQVEQVLCEGSWRVTQLGKIIKTAAAWKPDVIHMQYPSLGYPRSLSTILFALLASVRFPWVMTLHEALRWLSLPWLLSFIACSRSIIYVRHNYLTLLPHLLRQLLKLKPHQLILNASSIPVSLLNADQKSALRLTQLSQQKRLLAFFGFIFPGKGIELILDMMDANNDQLLIIGGAADQAYLIQLQEKIASLQLKHCVRFTGLLPAHQVADLLACADAVLLPLEKGAGNWNTSVHAALAQGSLVITSTLDEPHSDLEKNIFYVHPHDRTEILRICNEYAGRKVSALDKIDEWANIATQHLQIYESAASPKTP